MKKCYLVSKNKETNFDMNKIKKKKLKNLGIDCIQFLKKVLNTNVKI
jgi:hypothetical protein